MSPHADHPDEQQDVLTAERPVVKQPSRYKVLLHNDDYTSMEFVVEILMAVFHKSQAEASTIMFNVHQYGTGVAGIYPKEIAENKVATVDVKAREEGFPLLCTIEEA